MHVGACAALAAVNARAEGAHGVSYETDEICVPPSCPEQGARH